MKRLTATSLNACMQTQDVRAVSERCDANATNAQKLNLTKIIHPSTLDRNDAPRQAHHEHGAMQHVSVTQ